MPVDETEPLGPTTLAIASARAAAIRSAGGRVVFTNGCFDLVHVGHVRLLVEAKALGDWLVVGVNDDASVCRLKGEGRPFVALAERMEVLAALRPVDAVFSFSEDTPLAAIEALRPDVLVKGADWAAGQIVGADLVLGWGGRVERVGLTAGRSTTGLAERISLSQKEFGGS